MNKQITWLAAFTLVCFNGAAAQVFNGSNSAEIQSEPAAALVQASTEAEATAAIPAADAEANNIPVEQKIQMQAPLQQNINYTAATIEPQEAKRLVGAINTIEQIQVRRINRTAAENEKIDYQPTSVDPHNRDDIADFLNQKLLNQVEKSE